MNRFLGAAFVVLVAALVAACGDDDADEGTETVTVETSPPAEALSKSEFIEQADAICEDLHGERDPIENQAQEAYERNDYEEAADLLEEGVRVSRAAFAEIDALAEPPSDEQVVREMLDTNERGLVLIETGLDPLRNGDLDRFATLAEEAESIGQRTNGMAQGYGFKVCGAQE
jgi:hypothetical protein